MRLISGRDVNMHCSSPSISPSSGARGEEILDGGGGRGEKGKEALSLFRFHLPLFCQKRLILRLFVWFVCLFPRGRGPGGVLPYMGYIGMCRCEGYGFQAVYSRIGYINQSVWL